MLITCPTCASPYRVQGADLGAGRDLRCVTCGTVWVAARSRATPKSEAIHDPRSGALNVGLSRGIFHPFGPSQSPQSPRTAPASPRPAPSNDRAGILLATGLAALVAAMIAVVTREPIVRWVPGIASLYASVGLPINPQGLNIRGVKSILLEDGVSRVLSVEAEITNVRPSQTVIPELHVALRANDGHEIYTWTTPPPKAKLAAGESVAFRARLASPPEAAKEVSIRFAATEMK